MTFKEICKIEPEIIKLERDILKFRKEKIRLGAYVDRDWYGTFKPRMHELVGFGAKNPELKRCEDYDIVYTHLYSLLSKRSHKPLMN